MRAPRRRIQFTRAELEIIDNMLAIASASEWGEGDYVRWNDDALVKSYNSLRDKVWELISRADGLPNNLSSK